MLQGKYVRGCKTAGIEPFDLYRLHAGLDRLGNIGQDELARAFVAHLERRVTTQDEPVVLYGNQEMKRLLAE